MTRQFSAGYTDTAISGVTELDFPRGLLNFEADWRIKSNSGKEAVLVNITSPMDAQESIRVAFTEVANIFNGTGVERSPYDLSTKGVNMLVQLNEVWTETDDADAEYVVKKPASIHLVGKLPSHSMVTGARVEAMIGRLVSGLYETGLLTTDRLTAMLRGTLVPKDL